MNKPKEKCSALINKNVNLIKADFNEVRVNLSKLEKKYNPKDLDLHFYPLPYVDTIFFREILALAQSGLRLVNKNRDYCLNISLYDDGSFLYDLFLLIKSATNSIYKNKMQNEIHLGLVIKLLNILTKMSFYTTKQGGDISKRNSEALSNILFVFRSRELFDFVKRRASMNRLERIKEFLNDAVKKAERAIGRDFLGP